MKPPVTFQPAAHPRSRPLPPMEGEATAYGLVIHPSCQTYRRDLGYYDISDKTTGALVCESRTPGRNAALDALTARVRAYYQEHPGGDFRSALATARGQLAQPQDFMPCAGAIVRLDCPQRAHCRVANCLCENDHTAQFAPCIASRREQSKSDNCPRARHNHP